jgi:hypothetical protein
MKYTFFSILLIGTSFGCNTNTSPVTIDTTITHSNAASKMDLTRANPKQEAVQQYEEKVKDDLNNWFFKVQLFETKERFTYKMKLQYEEINGDDSITLPNLGEDPKPILKKGSKDLECSIGFMGNDGQFHEYKKVHIVNGNLKITTLNRYAVSVKP